MREWASGLIRVGEWAGLEVIVPGTCDADIFARASFSSWTLVLIGVVLVVGALFVLAFTRIQPGPFCVSVPVLFLR